MAAKSSTMRVAARANSILEDAGKKAAKRRRLIDTLAGLLADEFEAMHDERMRMLVDHDGKFILITLAFPAALKPISAVDLKEAV